MIVLTGTGVGLVQAMSLGRSWQTAIVIGRSTGFWLLAKAATEKTTVMPKIISNTN